MNGPLNTTMHVTNMYIQPRASENKDHLYAQVQIDIAWLLNVYPVHCQ